MSVCSSLTRLMVLVILALLSGLAARAAGPPTLEEADRSFAEQSYGAALAGYDALLAAGTVPAGRRDEVEYRAVECLGRSEQWDAALDRALAFTSAHRETVWEPRGLYWLGRLYVGVPHRGHRAGERIVRGEDETDTAEAGQPGLSLLQRDQERARDALEAAKVFYPAYRKEARTEAEEVQLNFDLARYLEQSDELRDYMERGKWPSARGWQIDPAAPYDPAWPPPKRIRYLYEQIELLAGAPNQAALGLFREALWLSAYQEEYSRRWERGGLRLRPIPYGSLNVPALLREIARRFPTAPVAPHARLTLAGLLERAGKHREAEGELRRLMREAPGSGWTGAAVGALESITRHTVTLLLQQQAPGPAARLEFSYRNVARVHFELYRVPIEVPAVRQGLLRIPRALPPPETVGPKVAEWDYDTRDPGDRRERKASIPLPVNDAGAYVVVASEPLYRTRGLLLLTDAVAVESVGDREVLVFAADGTTGRPLTGWQAIVRQSWSEGGKARVQDTPGVTDDRGLLSIPSLAGAGRTNLDATALVWMGSRYAVTITVGEPWHSGYWLSHDRLDVRGITDRNVYRPGQEVHFRVLALLPRQGSHEAPAAGAALEMTARDSRATPVYRANLTCGPFGTASGTFTLPPEAAPGEYRLDASVLAETGRSVVSSNTFRVEEYRKPEFPVTLRPQREHVRPGDAAVMDLEARYYFGAPVAGARVTYRIFRGLAWSGGRVADVVAEAGRGEHPVVISQGETVTDDAGRARIGFLAVPDPDTVESNRGMQPIYTVEATVEDQAGRFVQEDGAVVTAATDLEIGVTADKAYSRAGEPVSLTITTQDLDGSPAPVSGILRIVNDAGHVALRRSVRVGSGGEAAARWEHPKTGLYRASFTATDSYGRAQTGSARLLVAGPRIRLPAQPPSWGGGRGFRGGEGGFGGFGAFPGAGWGRPSPPRLTKRARPLPSFALIAQRPEQTAGETAKLLLVLPHADCTVLLTRERGGEIVDKRVVVIPDEVHELQVPLTLGDAPTAEITATTVAEGAAFTQKASIRVDSGRPPIAVSWSTGDAHPQPGETTPIRVTTRDGTGRPVRAELSVGATDAALDRIVPAAAPSFGLGGPGSRRRSEWTAFGEPSAYPGTVRSGGSRGLDIQPEVVDGQLNAERHAGHELEPGEWGRLDEWPGERAYLDNIWSDFSGIWVSSRRLRGGGMGGGGAPEFTQGGPEYDMSHVRVRFVDTAFWAASIITDANGEATVPITWPDNLTRWHLSALAMSADGRAVEGRAEVTVSKDLLVRLETPRFLVEKDEAVLTAAVHNYRDREQKVRVSLGLGGEIVGLARPEGGRPDSSNRTDRTDPTDRGFERPAVTVAAGGVVRVRWRVRGTHAGEARVRVSALGDDASDAVELTLPVLVHGSERRVTRSGVLRPGESAQVPFELPADRRTGSESVAVQLDPSVASVALDAIPYLIEYPYGCIEQTVSRFVPAALAAKALRDLGYDLGALRRRAAALRKQPGAPERARNPVFDSAELQGVIEASLTRIFQAQQGDGAWAWWRGLPADAAMTAYTLQGLLAARTAGVSIDDDTLGRGFDYLASNLSRITDPELEALIARVLALRASTAETAQRSADRLFARRAQLSAHGKALLALALADLRDEARAALVVRNLEGAGRIGAAAGTVHWDDPRGVWRMAGRIETNAAVLEALVRIQARSPLTGMLARWLAENRRAGAWESTRATAAAVTALLDYARAARELAPHLTVTAALDGRPVETRTLEPENMLLGQNRIEVPADRLRTGRGELELSVEGEGALYFSVSARYFSLEEPIPAAESGIAVTRGYVRLRPVVRSLPPPLTPDARLPNLFLERRYDLLADEQRFHPEELEREFARRPLAAGDALAAGDLVEVELELTSRNDFEYVLLEDPKPAGCESLNTLTATVEQAGLPVRIEPHDDRLALFLPRLPQGTRTLTHRLRVETPGAFHVLPARAFAMYAPDIGGNSGERVVTAVHREQAQPGNPCSPGAGMVR